MRENTNLRTETEALRQHRDEIDTLLRKLLESINK